MCLANGSAYLMGCYCGNCTEAHDGIRCLRITPTHAELDMKLMDGSLHSLMKKHNVHRIRYQCAIQIARGVQAIHSFGMIHRDIKPDNILYRIVGEHIVIKICDYGLTVPTTTADGKSTHTPDFMTLYYRAPEVFKSVHYGQAVDLWSFGCVLYELFENEGPLFDLDIPKESCADETGMLACMHLVAGDDIVVNHTAAILNTPSLIRTIRRRRRLVSNNPFMKACLISDPTCRATIQSILEMILKEPNKVV